MLVNSDFKAGLIDGDEARDVIIPKDNTSIYKQQIAPLVQEIRCLCNENKIPYFMTFGVKIKEDGTFEGSGGLANSALLPEILNIPANDPRFARFINVLHGFQTVLRQQETMDVDDDPCADLFDD